MDCKSDIILFCDINYKNGSSLQSASPLTNKKQMVEKLIGKKAISGSFATYYDKNKTITLAYVQPHGTIDDSIKFHMPESGKITLLTEQIAQKEFTSIRELVRAQLNQNNKDQEVKDLTNLVGNLRISQNKPKKILKFNPEATEISYSTPKPSTQIDKGSEIRKPVKEDRGLSPRQSKGLVFRLPKGFDSDEIKRNREIQKANRIKVLIQKKTKLEVNRKDIEIMKIKLSQIPDELLEKENKIMRKMLYIMDQIVALYTYG